MHESWSQYLTLTLLKANLVTPSFKAEVVKSLAALLKRDADCVRYFHPFAETVVRCTGAVEDRSAQRGIWLGSGTSGILARINNDLVEGLDGGSGTVISSTTAWPGILNGDSHLIRQRFESL